MDLLGGLRSPFNHRLVFWPGIVVSHLDAHFTSILSSALQRMPLVALASSGDDQVFQIDPGFADQVGLFVIVEDRYLESEVVG
jgi:hypothetical protein